MPFVGVYAAVRVVKRSGEQVDILAPDRPWLTSVTIVSKNGASNTIEVGFDAPYKQGVEALESDLFDIGNILLARVGYSKGGYMSPWYSAILTQPQVQISPNGVSGTLKAEGAGGLALVQGSGRTWGPTTRWAIMQTIAAKYGWEVVSSNLCRLVLMVDDDFSDSQGGRDDWSFLKDICGSKDVSITSSNSLSSNKATLVVEYRSEALAGQPKRTFLLMGAFDLSKNQYPVISFSCESPPGTVFNNAATRGTFHNALGPDAEIVSLKSDPTTVKGTALATGSVRTGTASATPDSVTGTHADVPVNDGSDPEAVGTYLADLPHADQDAIDAHVTKNMMGFPGLKITVETVGVPNIQPWELHEVRGASARFDGKYLVDSITHRVDSGGFSTTWTGIRNALATSGFPDTNADVNTMLPAEDGEALESKP